MTLVSEDLRRTFPKSVQPGIPDLKPPRPGWRSVRLGDVLEPVSRPVRMQDDIEYRLVTVKRSRGGIEERGRMLGRQIAVKSQFSLEGGDFLISKRQIVHGACAIVPDAFAGAIVSNEYSILRCGPELDLNFLGYLAHSVYFQQTCFHSSIGVHIEKMIFKLDKWLEWRINIPSAREQREIASFLGAIDGKLELLRLKAKGLSEFKAGLMQKLFSQEIRFTRDDGSEFPKWGEGSLADLAEINPRSGPLPDKFFYIDLESVNAGVLSNPKWIAATQAPSRAQRVLLPGDVLFQMVRPYQRNNLFFRPDGPFVGSTGYAQLRAKDVSAFVFQLIHTDEFVSKVLDRCTGTSYPAINSKDLGGIATPLPHPDEQRKIADVLTAVDTKIAVVRSQITEMETFKKGLLQQMFV